MRFIARSVLVFFFISGCSGLIYEIVWTRLLRHVMGNTVSSMTTVLCAFMGGLALGSYLAGRIIDRRGNPLLLYAVLEGMIGLYCLLLPSLVDAAEPLYRFFYQNFGASHSVFSMIRFVFCGVLLLPPATLMGATLPILTKFFTRSLDAVGWSIGRLYAINTFGAVLGAFSTGFLLMPALGTSRTLYLGCGLNFAISIAAFLLYRRSLALGKEASPADGPDAGDRQAHARADESPVIPEAGGGYGRSVGLVLLVGYGFSGLAALVYEIAWSRTLSLLVGSSVYAFSLMLTAFILGLAVGSAICGRFVDRQRDPLRSLGFVEIAVGFSALLVVPFFGWLPFFMTGMISRLADSFWMLQLAEFGLILVIMTIPTILMGAAFPLAIRIYTRSAASVGRSVGTVYSINTVGSILGAFAGGFILLPWLGIQNTILTAVLINLLLGCIFLTASRSLAGRWKGVMVGAVALAAAASCSLLPEWDQARMTLGPFMQATRLKKDDARSRSALEKIADRGKVIYYKEGITTTVSVKQDRNGQRVMFVNGKPDASSFGDLPTQILSAHAPMLLHRDPRSVLVIGLASGITLGSAGRHPVETLDCAEISTAVVEASHFFDEENYDILADPRVSLIVEDGRNHLALTNHRYDVIISEPSNPWIAGIGDLFTSEFYQTCQARLNPGGIVCCWLNSYNLDEEAFRNIVHTFHTVLGHMTIWQSLPQDYLLIGSRERLEVSYRTLVEKLDDAAIRGDLARIGIEDPADLLSRVVMTEQGIAGFVQGSRLHTDDNALLEFFIPRTMLGHGCGRQIRQAIEQEGAVDLSLLTSHGEDEPIVASVRQKAARMRKARSLTFEGVFFVRQGRLENGLPLLKQAARLDPDNAEAHYHLGIALGQSGKARSGVDHLEAAVRLDPNKVDARYSLAKIRAEQGRLEEAVNLYARILAIRPRFAEARYLLGQVLVRLGRFDEAIREFREVLEFDPDDREVRDALEAARTNSGSTNDRAPG